MAPAACIGLDPGARVIIQRGQVTSARVTRLSPSGAPETGWKGTWS
jgi:hypothetical protein